MKTFREKLEEASFRNNMGAIEMITFFQKASSKQIIEMEKVVKSEDWEAYKLLIKKVLGVKLQ